MTPRDLDLSLTLDAPREARLAVRANGRPVGDVLVRKEARQVGIRVPASVLFRGDNALTLAAPPGASPRVRLVRFVLRRAP
jgi:hypothetical protein